MNNNKFSSSNNKYNIINKIIPLFNVPITMKKRFELNKKTESKININKNTKKSLNQAITTMTKNLNKYTYKLSTYLISLINKLNINNNTLINKGLINNTLYVQNIKAIEIIKENYNYKINNNYKNFIYLTKIHLPKILYINSLFKLGIFVQLSNLKTKKILTSFYFSSLGKRKKVGLKKNKKFFILNDLPLNTSILKSFISPSSGPISSLNKPFPKDLKEEKYKKAKSVSPVFYIYKKIFSRKSNPFLNNLIKNLFSWTKLSINLPEKANVSNPNSLIKIGKADLKTKKTVNIFNKQLKLKKKTFLLKQNELLTYWQSKEIKNLLTNIITKGDLLLLELNSIIKQKELKQVARVAASASTINNNNNNKIIYKDVEKNTATVSFFPNSYNNTPVINQYLKSMSVYNMKKKGILIYFNNLVDYKFIKGSLGYINKLIFKIQKLLQASFKSMYCLISKPLFIITPNKITIKIFYFLLLPNFLKYKKLLNSSSYGITKYKKWKKNTKKFKQKKKQINKFRKLKKNIQINLIKLSNVGLTKVFYNKFKFLSLILSKLFKKPVEFDLTRLHYPYNDSTILVNLLGIMINKIKLRIIIRRLFEKAVIKNLSRGSVKNKISSSYALENLNADKKNTINIPAFLSGIKIKVGGRLLTQSVIPRKSVKITQRGATQRGKINFLDVARYTRKNKRGAFSITIKSGQNIF